MGIRRENAEALLETQVIKEITEGAVAQSKALSLKVIKVNTLL